MIRVVNVRGLTRPDQRGREAYVGRAVAGWPGHPLANPFRPGPDLDALTAYRAWVEDLDPDRLSLLLCELWEQTGGGRKQLGCWCVDAAAGDGSPEVCHAQVLAGLLRERFCCAGCGEAATDERDGTLTCGRPGCGPRPPR